MPDPGPPSHAGRRVGDHHEPPRLDVRSTRGVGRGPHRLAQYPLRDRPTVEVADGPSGHQVVDELPYPGQGDPSRNGRPGCRLPNGLGTCRLVTRHRDSVPICERSGQQASVNPRRHIHTGVLFCNDEPLALDVATLELPGRIAGSNDPPPSTTGMATPGTARRYRRSPTRPAPRHRRLPPSNVYAVGLDGEGLNAKSLVLRWDGTSWTRETTPGPKLYGAAAVAPSTLWGRRLRLQPDHWCQPNRHYQNHHRLTTST